jgi:2-amino-4-hydroxy-6-hydroxymethyldihydropteridine diphosphokinase
MPAAAHRFLVALGSNQRHPRFGAPRRVLAAALERLEAKGVRVIAAAPPIETDPVGPSIRRYANSAAVIETDLEPEALLALLKRIEREFGRRPGGQRWRARVLDLDLVLWSGGPFA